MLQIVSKKFFGGGELYEFEGRGILYSNMSWVRPIETGVGTLEPVDAYGSEVSSWVLSYVNRIEKEPAGGLVRTGDPEIVEQFGLLCMIWFGAFFDGDKQAVVVNCRQRPAHAGDLYIGSKFARPFLNPERSITEADEAGFVRFVDQAVGLPREDYLAVMGFLQTVSHALHALRQNFDLAYSMLVYALESLSKGRSDYMPRWEDYDERAKRRLDPILEGLAPEVSEEVRAALLEDANLKLQQRFLEFTLSHVPDRFFVEDARDVEWPMRPSELGRALKNAYRARSKYVHELRPVVDQIKTPGISEGEVFVWESKPYLTFNGLLRVARAVLLEFVEGQPYLEKEEYDWVSELPGRVTLEVAGQYWIWRHEDFSLQRGGEWLSSFLSVWLETVASREPLMPDLRPLLAKFESLLRSGSDEQRARMLAIHVLYNRIIAPESQSPGHEAVRAKNEKLLQACRIESMVLLLLTGEEWPWTAEECARAYEAYEEQKFHKGGLSLPPSVEAACLSYVAERHRDAGQAEESDAWSKRALLESAGEPDWQEHISDFRSEKDKVLDLMVFFPSKGEADRS